MSAFQPSPSLVRLGRATSPLAIAMVVAGHMLVEKPAQAADLSSLGLPNLHHSFSFIKQELICHKPERREAELVTLVRMVRSLESHYANGDGICYRKDGQLVTGPETFLGHAFGSGQIMPPTFTKLSMDLIADGSPYVDIYQNDPRFDPEIGNPLLNAEVTLWTTFALRDKKHEEKIRREIPKPVAYRGSDGKAMKRADGSLITMEQEALGRDLSATPIYVGLALRDVAIISLEEIANAPSLRKVIVTQLKDENLYEQVVDGSIRADQRRLENYLGHTPTFEQRMTQAARWWLGGKAPGNDEVVKSDGNVNDKGYIRYLQKALAHLPNPQVDAYADITVAAASDFVRALRAHNVTPALVAIETAISNQPPPKAQPMPPAPPAHPTTLRRILSWLGY